MALKFRRGTAAQKSGSLAFGEPYVNTTLGTLQVGLDTGDVTLTSVGATTQFEIQSVSASAFVSASSIYSTNGITGSIAATNGVISGSSQLSGTTIENLTITNLTTINQTSSIVFSSGSNKFGDFGNDIHSFTGSVQISGSITTIGTSTATSFNGAINATNGIVSGSSQVSYTGLNNIPSGIISSSAQIDTIFNIDGIVSGSSQLTSSYDERYVISGSITQTTWDNIASKPGGIVSGSAQTIANLPTGTVSGSSQVVSILDSLNTYTASVSSASLVTSIGNLTSKTGSYATTGSNTFIGTQTLSGSIIPAIDNVYDLGSATYQWRDIYVSSGSLYIDGTKVLGSTGNELQITTDVGQSIKILEAGSDSIILQSADGDIQLKTSGGGNLLFDPTSGLIDVRGTLQIQDGNKITSSGGNSIQFGDDIGITGSINTTGNVNGINLSTFSSSIATQMSTIQTNTGSSNIRLSNLESKSASVDISITNINSFTASNGNTSLNNLTGSLATTGSNTFFGTQTFSGSVYIANDLIVQGSSSIQYISASSVSIGTNIVQLNTANPSVRYAGLSIIDSGSIGGSGSFLYDSVQDEFIFVHRGNGTNVTSSHFVLGPETYDSLGNEIYLTTNRLPKGTGKEHLNDSNISDDGSLITLGSNTTITGTLVASGTSLVSSSAQVVSILSSLNTYTGSNDTTNTAQSARLTTIESVTGSYETKGRGVVSGSSQITYANISSIPSGVVSGSSQITFSGISSKPTTISGYGITDALNNVATSEQTIGFRYAQINNSDKTIKFDPRWNESTYDADLGTLHIYSTTAAGVNYGRTGIALYNGSAYQYLTTKASTTGLFVNNSLIATAGSSPTFASVTGTITESGTGDNNAPFRFGADYSGWMSHVAGTPGSNNGWGLFWAGNSGAQYGTNGTGGPGNIWSNSANPNEYVFVGNGSTNMSINGNTGNVWIGGELRVKGDVLPNANNTYDLGSASLGWRNVYTNDLHLSNEGKPEGNDVDGTTGNWTIQEGEEHLYIINNKTGKKFKFSLEEIQ